MLNEVFTGRYVRVFTTQHESQEVPFTDEEGNEVISRNEVAVSFAGYFVTSDKEFVYLGVEEEDHTISTVAAIRRADVIYVQIVLAPDLEDYTPTPGEIN